MWAFKELGLENGKLLSGNDGERLAKFPQLGFFPCSPQCQWRMTPSWDVELWIAGKSKGTVCKKWIVLSTEGSTDCGKLVELGKRDDVEFAHRLSVICCCS